MPPIAGWGDKGAHSFPKGISTKVNVIDRREYELIYFKVVIQNFGHYVMRVIYYYYYYHYYYKLY